MPSGLSIGYLTEVCLGFHISTNKERNDGNPAKNGNINLHGFTLSWCSLLLKEEGEFTPKMVAT